MKYLKVFSNWRIVVLTVLAMAAVLLVLVDCDCIEVFVLTKLVGFFLAYFAYRIGKYWKDKGMLDEINVFDEE